MRASLVKRMENNAEYFAVFTLDGEPCGPRTGICVLLNYLFQEGERESTLIRFSPLELWSADVEGEEVSFVATYNMWLK